MSNIAIKGAATGSGTFTLEAPATSTNRTLTLPDEAGTILTTATAGVPIGGPAFSATMSANQSITASTFTKVNFNTEEFDTNSNYDTTLYRFKPTVAGYYQISASVYPNTSGTAVICYAYKNGSVYKGAANSSHSAISTCLVYMNGSADYIEIYGYITGTSPVINGSSTVSYFQGALIRSAT